MAFPWVFVVAVPCSIRIHLGKWGRPLSLGMGAKDSNTSDCVLPLVGLAMRF